MTAAGIGFAPAPGAQPLEAPLPVRLEYLREEGAEACPDARHIEAMVAAQFGRAPFSPTAAAAVLATLRRAGPVWHASILAHDSDGNPLGQRALRVSARDCREVSETLAFTLAMVVDTLAQIGRAHV